MLQSVLQSIFLTRKCTGEMPMISEIYISVCTYMDVIDKIE